MNNYFNKIFCINLDRRSDKWEIVNNDFIKHGIQVDRFSAVDGEKLSDYSLTKYEQGCLQSHLAILKIIVKNKIQRSLILEDDVEFIENLIPYFSEKINLLPKWDMLYLGGNHVESPSKINEAFGKIYKTYTTSSYAITYNMARYCLETFKKSPKQIDKMYARLHPRRQCYCFLPSIAWQRPSYSDIQNKLVDYALKPGHGNI